MIVIGITGSIGMGKSTVANMLQEIGIPVHDADVAVASFLSADGSAIKFIKQYFPEAIYKNEDGLDTVDKQILGRIVFNDREKKLLLESILHPMVITDSNKFLTEKKTQGYKLVALEIPLLFEINRDKDGDIDTTICVSCSPENQQSRVLSRANMTSEKFAAIVAGQMTDADKKQRADYVILNDGDLEETRENLYKILERIKEKFKHKIES